MTRDSKATASRVFSVERKAGDGALQEIHTRRTHPGPRAASGRSAGEALLRTLMLHVDAIAAFCVVWPSEFAYAMADRDGEGIAGDDVFAVPRDDLLAAFAVDHRRMRPLAAAWRVELLPPALQRPPFVVPDTTKLTLPICLGGHLLGFAGLAIQRALGDVERAWHRGIRAALGQSSEPIDSRPAVFDGPSDAVLVDVPALASNLGLQAPEEKGSGARASATTSGEACKLLSPREREIATYLAEGHSTINVGAILGLSAATVRTHVRRIYAKLNVCSRVELVHRMRS